MEQGDERSVRQGVGIRWQIVVMTMLPMGASGVRLPAVPATRKVVAPLAISISRAIAVTGAPTGSFCTDTGRPPSVPFHNGAADSIENPSPAGCACVSCTNCSAIPC